MQYRHDKKIISSHDLLAIDVFSWQKLRDARTGIIPGTGRKNIKMQPCVIISPDEMNRHLRTLIIAPVTSR